MDADGATGLDGIEEAWRHLMLGADVVIGSRGLAASVTAARHSRSRSAGAAAYRRLAARLLPGIADTQCGFKFFRGHLVRTVVRDLRADGFAFDVELLVRLRAAGARLEEIPVTWSDVPGSTFSPARHGASAFAELGRIAWRTRGAALPATAGGRAAGLPLPAHVAVQAGLAATVVPLVVAAHAELQGSPR